MNKFYRIDNCHSSTYLGTYKADSENDALEIMAQDAGYKNRTQMDEVAPSQADEILVTEIICNENYYMNVNTGSVDTLEYWQQGEQEVQGTEMAYNVNRCIQDGILVPVVKDHYGNWVEFKE